MLSSDDKNKILHRLGQYYEKEKEYVNNKNKELLIKESYTSQKGLENLADAILSKILEYTKKYNSTEFKTINLSDLNYTDERLYKFIKDNQNLIIQICSDEYFGSHKNSKGLFSVKDNGIFVRYNGDVQDFSLYKMQHYFKSTLLYELQHAYDNWISKGKALKFNDIANDDMYIKYMSNLQTLKEEELEYVSKKYKEYQNSPDEINARFNQCVYKIDFYNLDLEKTYELEKEVFVIQPFNSILKDFKRNFDGYVFFIRCG
jgi:hypothetical protein